MKKYFSLTLVALVLASCASIIKGTEQQINIVSEKDVEIYVDGVKTGTETAIARVKKGDVHSITVKKEGCETLTVETGEAFDTTSLLGILIDFGIISIPVDLASGAAWKVEPTLYNVTPICK